MTIRPPGASLHAGIERPRHREGPHPVRRRRHPRSRGFGGSDGKAAARAQVAEAVIAGGFGAREVIVRITGSTGMVARGSERGRQGKA